MSADGPRHAAFQRFHLLLLRMLAVSRLRMASRKGWLEGCMAFVESVHSEKRRRSQAKMCQGCGGWSLLEMAAVILIIFIVMSFAVLSFKPAWQDAQVNQAYNQTLELMRRTRQMAIDQRKEYYLTFVAPNQIQMFRQDGGNPLPPPVFLETFSLLNNMQFLLVAGVPVGVNVTPDNMGIGANAIDFDIGINGGGYTSLYFMPDGSVQDQLGNINNGIVYIARPNDLYSSRAITMFGLSGRTRGWRLSKNQSAGTNVWSEI
jgi:type II secretory pathway pseudopilin PulG